MIEDQRHAILKDGYFVKGIFPAKRFADYWLRFHPGCEVVLATEEIERRYDERMRACVWWELEAASQD